MIRRPHVFVLTGVIIILAVLVMGVFPSLAAPPLQGAPPTPTLIAVENEYCLGCHGSPGQTLALPDGSQLDLYVDPLDHANSIHGKLGYACVQCHPQVGRYPHPAFEVANQREATLKLNNACQACHQTQFARANDSVHSKAQAAGNRAAATCSDCHTAHAVREWVDSKTRETLPEARTVIPTTCALCHSQIYAEYRESVHGSALTDENNPDVPTCIDCHGVHNISDPTTSSFRVSSPELCAKCHTDAARMTKYGISTQVINTYVADFHGTTVTIFDKQSPDQQTNKPVCVDCHGVHNIKRADDPEKGLQVKQNMLAACQKCHPDAGDNFSAAWLSHYIPSAEKYPLVYFVDLFYKFLIPTVLGGMALLVFMDGSRMTINLVKAARHKRTVSTKESNSNPSAVDSPPAEAQDTPPHNGENAS